jgi:RNA polymerase sigma-70 factor (ECF subfamily)
MMSLPEKYREPIILCKINGLKYKEIAETLNLSKECIKKRIHRGIGMLREYLEQSGEIDR